MFPFQTLHNFLLPSFSVWMLNFSLLINEILTGSTYVYDLMFMNIYIYIYKLEIIERAIDL